MRRHAKASLNFGRNRISNSAPAMIRPEPPLNQLPRMQLIASPPTCTVMIAMVSSHPQRFRRNQPIPAAASATASNRKRTPTVLRKGKSSSYGSGLRLQMRSRRVPGRKNVKEARPASMVAQKRKMPIAVKPRGEALAVLLRSASCSSIAIEASEGTSVCRRSYFLHLSAFHTPIGRVQDLLVLPAFFARRRKRRLPLNRISECVHLPRIRESVRYALSLNPVPIAKLDIDRMLDIQRVGGEQGPFFPHQFERRP